MCTVYFPHWAWTGSGAGDISLNPDPSLGQGFSEDSVHNPGSTLPSGANFTRLLVTYHPATQSWVSFPPFPHQECLLQVISSPVSSWKPSKNIQPSPELTRLTVCPMLHLPVFSTLSGRAFLTQPGIPAGMSPWISWATGCRMGRRVLDHAPSAV